MYSRAYSDYRFCVMCFINILCKQFEKHKLDKMTLHLHFILKISADLFGSLKVTLSALPSFENL